MSARKSATIPLCCLIRDPLLRAALERSSRDARDKFAIPAANLRNKSGIQAANRLDRPRRLPALDQEGHLLLLGLCQRRARALLRTSRGRRPDKNDAAAIVFCEEFLAQFDLTPSDFGFVDPPLVNPALRARIV